MWPSVSGFSPGTLHSGSAHAVAGVRAPLLCWLGNALFRDYTTFCLPVCQLTVLGAVLHVLFEARIPGSLPEIEIAFPFPTIF